VVFRSQGKFAEAEHMYREELELTEARRGKEHISALISQNNLALTLRYQGKLDEAEEILFEALAKCTKLLGQEHLLTLRIRTNYAIALGFQSRAGAEQALREALDASTRSLGVSHPETLASKGNLARLLWGRYADTEVLYREIIAAWKALGGTNHPGWLNEIAGLSSVLRNQGVFEEAGELQGQVFELSTKIFGPQHPFSSNARSTLSRI
jgi:tetratricopeptide (TPR) repeat protein